MAADGKIDAKETSQLIAALSADGKVSLADQNAVLSALASDGKVSKEDIAAIVALVSNDGKLSSQEKQIVASALIQSVAPGDNLTKEQVAEAGIKLSDLPPSTPVDVRTSENGESVVINAEVAVQVELLQNPTALVQEMFSDPGAALQALGSVGADMTPAEREQSTKMVVATVIATGAALNAVGVTAAAAAASTGGSTGGSRSGGGNSGGSGGGSSGDTKGVRRRKE